MRRFWSEWYAGGRCLQCAAVVLNYPEQYFHFIVTDRSWFLNGCDAERGGGAEVEAGRVEPNGLSLHFAHCGIVGL